MRPWTVEARKALDEMMDNYINPNTEGITDDAWNDMDTACYEILCKLLQDIQSH